MARKPVVPVMAPSRMARPVACTYEGRATYDVQLIRRWTGPKTVSLLQLRLHELTHLQVWREVSDVCGERIDSKRLGLERTLLGGVLSTRATAFTQVTAVWMQIRRLTIGFPQKSQTDPKHSKPPIHIPSLCMTHLRLVAAFHHRLL